MPLSLTTAPQLDEALKGLVTGAMPGRSPESTRAKIIVIPNGPEKLLAPEVPRYWAVKDLKRDARCICADAEDIIKYNTIAPGITNLLGQPGAVFFEPLDKISRKQDAQEALHDFLNRCSRNDNIKFVAYSRRHPRDLGLWKRLNRLLLDKTKVQIQDWSVYTSEAKVRYELYFKEKLKERLSGLTGVIAGHPELLDQITSVCLETIDSRRETPQHIVDPDTGLMLPPASRTLYQDRSAKYRRRIDPIEFLRQEWADYTKHHLLYAEHIRVLDYPLYKALQYQAKAKAVPFPNFLFQNGILGKEHVLKPPAGYERQARVVKAARLRRRAQALNSLAKHLSAGD